MLFAVLLWVFLVWNLASEIFTFSLLTILNVFRVAVLLYLTIHTYIFCSSRTLHFDIWSVIQKLVLTAFAHHSLSLYPASFCCIHVLLANVCARLYRGFVVMKFYAIGVCAFAVCAYLSELTFHYYLQFPRGYIYSERLEVD